MLDGRAGETVTVWIEGSTDVQVMIRKRNMTASIVARSERGTETGGAHTATSERG